MGLIYSFTQASAALNANSSDFMTMAAGATRSHVVREYTMAGLGTASAANEVGFYRNTLGTVATASFVPHNAGASAAAARTAAAPGQTTTLGVKYHSFGLNANGALFRWVAGPGMGIETSGALQNCIRGVAGTSSATGMVIIEEF